MQSIIKKTYVTRDVLNFSVDFEINTAYRPLVGDVGLFEVIETGKHKSVQSDSKRNVTILEGDRILAAFGTRYATAQFEGYVPEDCNRELHILGAGGTVGVIASMHSKFSSVGPTRLKFLGLAKDADGKVINTKKLYETQMTKFCGGFSNETSVILSVGSSMDSGKTTSAAYLVRGLRKAGFRVAFIKLTGTIYTKDCDLNFDLGANMTADFGDMGFPSTYMCSEEELLDLYESLVRRVMIVKPDYIIMEIADGLYQRETKMLLTNRYLMSTIHAVMFSAGDSLAAINGIQVLGNWGVRPFAISGLLTASPLLISEVREHCSLPVYTLGDLSVNAKTIMQNNNQSYYKPLTRFGKAS